MPGLYLHIPFCRRKCHYCDFHMAVSLRRKNELVNAICRELELRKNEIPEPFDTVYFGGGTPTVLDDDDWKRLFQCIRANYDTVPGAEISVEANPEDITPGYLDSIISLGVNRLSIGIQSFDDDILTALNRSHTAAQALRAVALTRAAGIENISIDLIYGIPQLTDKVWKDNLHIFKSLNIPHLSAYALTVEPRTALDVMIRKGRYPQVDEEQAARQYGILVSLLEHWGYTAYELSNFALPGYESRHNSSYWSGAEYLGAGPSAHSLIGNVRYANIANNARYIKFLLQDKLPRTEEHLETWQLYNEFVMLGLRTAAGVDLDILRRRFGAAYEEYLADVAKPHLISGRLVRSERGLKVHSSYRFVSDSIVADLFLAGEI